MNSRNFEDFCRAVEEQIFENAIFPTDLVL